MSQTQPSLAKQEKIRKQREEREENRQREQQKIREAFNQQGELSQGWMEDLLDTDDLEEELDPATVRKIQGLLNKQWIIANLSDAETHDRTYKLEVMKRKILATHPPTESRMTGKIRAFLHDDPWEELHPLTQHERNQIDQVITTLQNMVTRSRGGFERKQQQTSIAKTEQERREEDSDSGGFWRFG